MKDSLNIDTNATFPLSARLSAQHILRLNILAAQMNTSTGKILTGLLEDFWPALDAGRENMSVRLVKLHKALKSSGMLQAVNIEDEKRKILNRGEGQPRGRPRKDTVH
jgi:hypothetical protein